jgi:hypothetical protein
VVKVRMKQLVVMSEGRTIISHGRRIDGMISVIYGTIVGWLMMVVKVVFALCMMKPLTLRDRVPPRSESQLRLVVKVS